MCVCVFAISSANSQQIFIKFGIPESTWNCPGLGRKKIRDPGRNPGFSSPLIGPKNSVLAGMIFHNRYEDILEKRSIFFPSIWGYFVILTQLLVSSIFYYNKTAENLSHYSRKGFNFLIFCDVWHLFIYILATNKRKSRNLSD